MTARARVIRLDATQLRLFELDGTKLVYRKSGREVTLTDGQAARVVREVLREG